MGGEDVVQSVSLSRDEQRQDLHVHRAQALRQCVVDVGGYGKSGGGRTSATSTASSTSTTAITSTADTVTSAIAANARAVTAASASGFATAASCGESEPTLY
jgi:hypothetical protein